MEFTIIKFFAIEKGEARLFNPIIIYSEFGKGGLIDMNKFNNVNTDHPVFVHFDRIENCKNWPSSDPNDKPSVTYKCKMKDCNWQQTFIVYGNFPSGDDPEAIILPTLRDHLIFHHEKREGLNTSQHFKYSESQLKLFSRVGLKHKVFLQEPIEMADVLAILLGRIESLERKIKDPVNQVENNLKAKLISAINQINIEYVFSCFGENVPKTFKSSDDIFKSGVRRGLEIAKTIIQH